MTIDFCDNRTMILMYASVVLGSVSAYGVAGWCQWTRHTAHGLFSLCAIVLHTLWLYLSIEQTGGQDLSFFNVLAQIAWGTVLTGLWFARQQRLASLMLVLYLFAAISILMSFFFPLQHIVDTKVHSIELIHIVLSIMTMTATVFMAMMGLLVWLEPYWLQK